MLLLIGYGNPVRQDDRIGLELAAALAARGLAAKMVTAHQLTPELAVDISGASLVVFIDARDGGAPGEIASAAVAPVESSGAFTHHVTPASLLAASRDLYGALPAGLLVTVSGASFDYGTTLSPALSAALPDITEDVLRLIERQKELHHA